MGVILPILYTWLRFLSLRAISQPSPSLTKRFHPGELSEWQLVIQSYQGEISNKDPLLRRALTVCMFKGTYLFIYE